MPLYTLHIYIYIPLQRERKLVTDVTDPTLRRKAKLLKLGIFTRRALDKRNTSTPSLTNIRSHEVDYQPLKMIKSLDKVCIYSSENKGTKKFRQKLIDIEKIVY